MTLEGIQQYFADRFAADSVLAALGTARIANPLDDHASWAADIDSRLRAKGVCLEVGFPEGLQTTTNAGGVTRADAACMIYVSESADVAHTPALAALVNRVIVAMTTPPSATIKAAHLDRYDAVMIEGGRVEHQFLFFVPVLIK